jgi:hypothetical protein
VVLTSTWAPSHGRGQRFEFAQSPEAGTMSETFRLYSLVGRSTGWDTPGAVFR